METAPHIPGDELRIAQLHALQILDTAREREFDDLVQLASFVAGTPIALLSLVDRDRQWFKACVGLEATQTARDISFCAHAIAGSGPLVVNDAYADPRFADNPLVTGEPHIRFYAGLPIGAAGQALGTLCVLDHEPRALSDEQLAALERIARQASAQLTRRRRASLLQGLEVLIHRLDSHPITGEVDLGWIQPALALGNELLGTSIAIVSHIVDDTYTVLHTASPPDTISAGDAFPLGRTYCAVTLAANGVVAIDDAANSEYASHPCYVGFGLATYIGVPLWVGDERVGTLNFSHPEPRDRPWSAEERSLIALLGQRFGHALAVGAQLGQRASLIRVVADHVPGGLAYVDAAGMLRFANKNFAAARGGDAATLLGTPAVQTLALGDVVEARRHLERALAGESTHHIIDDRTGADGCHADIETIYTPARGENGEVGGVIVLELDVTAHRRAAKGLANVRRMMDSLDQVGEGVCFYDADDRLKLWNPAHARLLADTQGVVVEGAAYQSLAHAWASADSATSDAPTESLLTEHLGYHEAPMGVLERVGPGQRVFLLRELKLPDGGTVVSTSEVTELRRSEREITRSNEDLRQFAHVASHDLREPLRMITSYLSLLKMRLEDHLDADGERHMGYVLEGAERMRGLIDGLMSFTLLERTTSTPVETELTEVVDAALLALAVRVEETDAIIERGPLPRIPADPVQLAQLFQNAIDNAIKFAKPGHRPHVRIEGRALGDHRWEVSVTDQGIGLSQKFAGKAFDVFARGQSRDDFDGTGIGLAIARKVVENHGGRVWFDLDYEGGARLVFTLERMN